MYIQLTGNPITAETYVLSFSASLVSWQDAATESMVEERTQTHDTHLSCAVSCVPHVSGISRRHGRWSWDTGHRSAKSLLRALCRVLTIILKNFSNHPWKFYSFCFYKLVIGAEVAPSLANGEARPSSSYIISSPDRSYNWGLHHL